MANPGTMETLVDGAVTFINANFSAYLTAIDSNLSAPTFELGYRDVFNLSSYPDGRIVIDSASPEESAAHADYLTANMDLLIAIYTKSTTDLQTHMMRYTDAALKLLRENPTFGGLSDLSEFYSADYYLGPPSAKNIGLIAVAFGLEKEIVT